MSKNEKLSKDEALENAIKISVKPHFFTLHADIDSEVWAECFPYTREIYHYLPLTSKFMPSVESHESDHIAMLGGTKFWYDTFFLDLLRHMLNSEKLSERVEICCGDNSFVFTKCSVDPLKTELLKLIEANAIRTQFADSDTPKELKEKITEDLRCHEKKTYSLYRYLASIPKQFVRHLEVGEKKHSVQERIRYLLVSELLNVDFKDPIQLWDCLALLEKRLQDFRKDQLGVSFPGIDLALLDYLFSGTLSEIKVKKHNELNDFKTLLLFLMSCFKDDSFDPILEDYAFGFGQALNKFQIIFRVKNVCAPPPRSDPVFGRVYPSNTEQTFDNVKNPRFPALTFYVPNKEIKSKLLMSCTEIPRGLLELYGSYLAREEPILVKSPEEIKKFIKSSSLVEVMKNYIAAYYEAFNMCPYSHCYKASECPLKRGFFRKLKIAWAPLSSEVINTFSGPKFGLFHLLGSRKRIEWEYPFTII